MKGKGVGLEGREYRSIGSEGTFAPFSLPFTIPSQSFPGVRLRSLKLPGSLLINVQMRTSPLARAGFYGVNESRPLEEIAEIDQRRSRAISRGLHSQCPGRFLDFGVCLCSCLKLDQWYKAPIKSFAVEAGLTVWKKFRLCLLMEYYSTTNVFHTLECKETYTLLYTQSYVCYRND